MSVTRKEMLEIQEAERMRRLNMICAGLASRQIMERDCGGAKKQLYLQYGRAGTVINI